MVAVMVLLLSPCRAGNIIVRVVRSERFELLEPEKSQDTFGSSETRHDTTAARTRSTFSPSYTLSLSLVLSFYPLNPPPFLLLSISFLDLSLFLTVSLCPAVRLRRYTLVTRVT